MLTTSVKHRTLSPSASFRSCLALIFLAAVLAGCLSGPTGETPGPVPTPTETPLPTPTATPEPLGSPANPLVFAVVAEGDPTALDPALATFTALLSQQTRFTVTGRVYASYVDLMAALSKSEVHLTSLPPMTYLYASQRGLVQVSLLINHFGVYQYGTQFLANAESGFTLYFDPISGLNSADAATALAQFAGLRPCYVDPGSVSGYIVAAGLLAQNRIASQEPSFAQSHAGVVRSLYIKGVCDFGATFSILGDPRTGSSVLSDLPDTLNRIPIVWRSDSIIPNLNISTLSGLPEPLSAALQQGFLDLARSQEGRAALTAALNNYEVDDIRAVEDTIYNPLRELSQALFLDLGRLVGK